MRLLVASSLSFQLLQVSVKNIGYIFLAKSVRREEKDTMRIFLGTDLIEIEGIRNN